MTRTSRGPLAEWIWGRRAKLTATAVAVMAVVSIGQTAWYSWEQQKCNENFAQNLATRSKWAQQDRRALDGLIVSVFEDGGTKQQAAIYARWRQAQTLPNLNRLIVASFEGGGDAGGRKAYAHWRHVTQRNAELRKATPLPDLASCD